MTAPHLATKRYMPQLIPMMATDKFETSSHSPSSIIPMRTISANNYTQEGPSSPSFMATTIINTLVLPSGWGFGAEMIAWSVVHLPKCTRTGIATSSY